MPNNPQGRFQNSFQNFMKNQNGGFNGVFAGFGALDKRGGGAGGKKPAAKPNKPAPNQWTFQPNPLDQPPQIEDPPLPPAGPGTLPPGNPGTGGGQNPWSFSPPIRPWMFNPTGGQMGGGWQDPGFSGNFPPDFFASARPPQIGGPGPAFDPQQAAQQWPPSGMSDMMYRSPGWSQPPSSQPTGSNGTASWYYPPKY